MNRQGYNQAAEATVLDRTPIQINESLTLTTECGASDSHVEFDLAILLLHIGSDGSGHYVTLVRQDNKYVLLNDNNTPVEFHSDVILSKFVQKPTVAAIYTKV